MCLLGKALFEFTFKRSQAEFKDDSKMAEKLMGKKFPLLCENTEKCKELLLAIPHEEVEIKTADGLTLKGWFFNANSNNTIIFVHGYNSFGFRDNSGHGYHFFNHDYNVLIADNRAAGESEGTYGSFGIKESEDTVLWVKYIADRYPNGNIALHGTSLGGATVCFASEKELPNVKVIVEDCAFTSILEEFYCVAKLFVGFKPKLLIKSSERFAKKKLGIDYTTLSPIKSVANAKYPMMFVHGKDDAFIPCVSANLLYDACPTEKELLLIDDFGHASSQLAGDDYYKPVFAFVDKYCK